MPQLAQALQLKSKGSINHYEKGTSLPTLSNLVAIAEYFSVTTDYLLGLSDNLQVPSDRTEEILSLQQQIADLKDELSIIQEVQVPCKKCEKLENQIASLKQNARNNQFNLYETILSKSKYKCIKTSLYGYHLFIDDIKTSLTSDDFFATMTSGMLETIDLLKKELQSPPADPNAKIRLEELATALRVVAQSIDETVKKSY
ncbi:MAG: hypothetical protein H6Q72_3671 [Firmicutes bacterium]|nr:hypothetical protein [Bacillota bacterium]